MSLIKTIIPGTSGWDTIIYVDDTKYVGYTLDGEIRNGLGTLFTKEGSVLKRGLWENGELIESIEEPEYGKQVNATLEHKHQW